MTELIITTESQLSEIVRRHVGHAITDLIAKPMPEILTKSELAEYLRCDVSKINRLRPPSIKFGSHPRYRKSDIDRWLNGRTQEVSRQEDITQ